MTVIQYKKSRLSGGPKQVLIGTAGENIQKFTILCTLASDPRLVTASHYIKKCNIVGVSIETACTDNMIQYINTGTVESATFKLEDSVSKLVYLGVGGMPTTTRPKTGNAYIIGTRLSETSFLMNLNYSV